MTNVSVIILIHKSIYLLNYLGLDVDNQLPPPIPTAKLLKQFAATSIKKWHEKFGTTYKLLDIGYNYLKNCKFVNFDNVDEPIGITAQIQRERNEANQIRLREKLENATRELNGFFKIFINFFLLWIYRNIKWNLFLYKTSGELFEFIGI